MIITQKNYKGRVWTCDEHNNKIEGMIAEGKAEEAMRLVAILNPKKSKGICKECARLYYATPNCNR
jgi:hypothetical protein